MSRITRPLLQTLAFLLPVGGALFLAAEAQKQRLLAVHEQAETLLTVRVASVEEAERLFEELDYQWPPPAGPTVPRIAVEPLPRDLDPAMPAPRKKALFFRLLLPLVLAENRELRAQRRQLLRLLEYGGIPPEGTGARHWLDGLLQRYRVTAEDPARAVEQLLERLDELPPALVLAQAANESAWGTSRFARVANNLFGQWTWQEEHGIVPAARPEGERYLVRKFPSLRDSVRDYFYNLNVGHAYQELRRLRREMRAAGSPLDPLALAGGLQRYSQRGEAYVEEIRRIIRANRLERLRDVDLMPLDAVRRLAWLWAAAGSTGG